jgi:hypothetical protein
MRRIYFFRARDRVAGAARAVVARSRARIHVADSEPSE